MPLLSARDRQTVQTHLEAISHPVTLLFFTQSIGAPDTVAVARQILEEAVGLNARLKLEEVNLVLERERAATYGIDRVPAIVLLKDGADTRMRFLGAPAGYEFMSLIEALVLAGTDDSGLSAASRQLVAQHVTAPVAIKVFATPT